MVFSWNDAVKKSWHRDFSAERCRRSAVEACAGMNIDAVAGSRWETSPMGNSLFSLPWSASRSQGMPDKAEIK
jgi:hypothetical protein